MWRTARGLIWEEWRCTRKLLGSILALTGFLMLATSRVTVFGRWSAAEFHMNLAIGILGTFLISLPLSHSTKDNIHAGMPTRRYLLPASTFALVFWPLMYRLAAVALVAVVACWLSGGFGGPETNLGLVCLAVAVAAQIQMLAWCARLVGKVFTALGFFLLIGLGLNWTFGYLDAGPLPYPLRQILVPLVSTAVALIVTTLALSLLRSGGWGRRGKVAAASGASEASEVSAVTSDASVEPFRSRVLAQIWFEWRSHGKKMAWILSSPSFALVALMGYVTGAPVQVLFKMGWTFLGLMAVPAGLWTFARRRAQNRRDAARFKHSVPVDDSVLALGRLGASAATVVASLLAVTLFAVLVHFAFVTLGLSLSMANPPESQGEIASYGLILPLVFAGTWIAYTRGGLFTLAFFALGIGSEVVETYAPDLYARFYEMTGNSLPLAFRIAFIGSVPLLCIWIGWAFRAGALPKRAMPVLAGGWVLGAALTTACVYGLMDTSAQASETIIAGGLWTGVVALTLLALTPFATEALDVQRMRHGR